MARSRSTSSNRRFVPSVFTPFWRRWFGDETAREISDTAALYIRVTKKFSARDHERVVSEILFDIDDNTPPTPISNQFRDFALSLVYEEDYLFPVPDLRPEDIRYSLKDAADLRNLLHRQERFLHFEQKHSELLTVTILEIILGLIDDLPEFSNARPLFSVPLVTLFRDPLDVINKIIGTLADTEHAFAQSSDVIYKSICRFSKQEPYTEHKKPLTLPLDSKLNPLEATDVYLQGTPFHRLLTSPAPLSIPRDTFFEHMHVVGGSGAGKSQFLSHLILHQLEHSLVVIDSQGDLIGTLSRLEAIKDRVILITPKDISHPPAINVFDINRGRLEKYGQLEREQVVAGAIQTLDYCFSSILGADLTAKQSTLFRFVARLMLALPETMGRNATILDMLALMDDPTPYQPAIEKLPPLQRQFFERDFPQKHFNQTREQIRYRLNALLENPTLQRLFTAEETKVDIFSELNKGSIILVDTAKDFLKDASANFGKLFITLVLQAVMERAAIPEKERKPAFLIVDEAAEYFGASNIDDLLTQVRKYHCGCVFAHQYMDQCSPQLRASLAANTSIKMASGVSMTDARSLAPDLRTTADFVLSQPRLHFALYVRHVLGNAVSVPVPVGKLDEQPMMDDEEYHWFRVYNSRRVSGQEDANYEDVVCDDIDAPRLMPPRRLIPAPEDDIKPGEW